MPNPCSYDSKDSFMAACIPERQDENPDEDQAQSVAICSSMWDERECEGKSVTRAAPKGIQHKAGTAQSVGEREAIFIASSESVDRHGDIVRQNWVTRNFMRNPVFLLQHAHDSFPIGKVKKWWTEGTKSFAHVVALPEGMDETADKAWRFIKAGFLNAVSVGFLPTQTPKVRKDADGYFLGYEYPQSELLELSLVSVPANSDALAVAKSIGCTERDVNAIFLEPKGVPAGVKSAQRYVDIKRWRVRS